MPDAEPTLEGRLIAGNFRIERLLGRGAMGQVFLAEQVSLGKKVAIKVLHRHLQGDEALARRFQREAKAASSLNHPNSLQIIDFGQSEQGELFIAMELLSGRDLARLLHAEFPLPLERIVRIMGQVLSALDEAHAQNIIHRDLKPENIMIVDRRGERDFVKVCDFGIAKIQDAKSDGSSGTITMAGVVCGTPEYMSPEQCRGEKLDGRSDLYAAGVILYQLTTGTLPFSAETALGIVTKHLTEVPVPPSRRRPDLSIEPALETLILRSMAKQRVERPATAFEMKEVLEGLLRGRSHPGLRVPSAVAHAATISPADAVPLDAARVAASAGGPPPSTLAGELVGSGELRLSRGRPARILALVGLAGALGLGGVLLLRGRGTPSGPGTGSSAAQVQAPAPAPAPAAQPDKPPAPLEGGGAAAGPKIEPAGPAAAAPAETPPSPPAPAAEPAKRRPHRTRVAAAGAKAARGSAPTEAPREDAPKAPAEPAKPAGRPAEIAFGEGKQLFDQSRRAEAIAKFLEAARLDPSYAEAYKWLGKTYMRQGDSDTAKRYYRKYLDLRPNDVFVREILSK